MSLRDIACDVGECKRNTSQTHTMVKFENTFSTKLKKNHKNQDKPLEEDGGLVAPDGMSTGFSL